METIAKLHHARISPLKARLVAKQVRGLPVERALNLLKFMPQKAAFMIKSLLESAIANAEHNQGADIDLLIVYCIRIDKAGSLRRMMTKAKGRGSRISKPLSHIYIKLSERIKR